jgi:FlaA1/EpsC-like NDP-sugar epimerase
MKSLSVDPYSPVYQRVIDGVIAALAFWFAYEAFFNAALPAPAQIQLWELLLVVAAGRLAANELLGCYRTVWRYFGLRDLLRFTCSCALFSLALLLARLIPSMPLLKIPVGIIVLELLLSSSGAAAARVARRLLYERTVARQGISSDHDRVLLIGAGRAGVNVANQLRASGSLRPIGFLDDDPKKIGLFVAGLKVHGAVSMLDVIATRDRVHQVIVCMAKPAREMLRRIWATCELLGLAVRILPPIEEMLDKKNSMVNFRNIAMHDLLGRQPIQHVGDNATVFAAYQGKRILITGAGGSIGSELALQLSQLDPRRLLLLDKDENGLNDTLSRLRNTAEASAIVADLRFSERLQSVLRTLRPEVVFHAAAHKHVHLMEENPCEAITNNVTGTRNLVEQSLAFGMSRFVQVSTDKAVNPTSIMGATKRLCEMIVQSQGHRNRTLFCCVRFGNVLGSRGSVVPIFQEQIQRGGPVTVTHPEAERFLMTIPEAVCLLIQAGVLANNRDIFVLDMGVPVVIRRLAEDLIELSGLSPYRDIQIEITGLRRGEKLSEVLLENPADLRATEIERIKAIRPRAFDMLTFNQGLHVLERAAWDGNTDEVFRQLGTMDIGYTTEVAPRPWPSPSPKMFPVPAVARTLAPETS